MSKIIQVSFAALLLFAVGCQSVGKISTKNGQIDEAIVISQNVEELRNSSDKYSKRIDSILSGFIESSIISTGVLYVDLNGDESVDIGFEIINLQPLNNNNLPDHLDSLAVRVIPVHVDVLDNSTYGYADALDNETSIDANEAWDTERDGLVLGTFANAGNFNGKGWKYLGFRLNDGENSHYGWIEVNVSENNNAIELGAFAYNETPNSAIEAGQVD